MTGHDERRRAPPADQIPASSTTPPVNGDGSSAERFVTSCVPSGRQRRTTAPRENSSNAWRHAPHGRMPVGPSPATAMATIERTPADIAAPSATRSAHIVKPSDAFSTFAPVNVRPSADNTAAPTWNCEYGAYAFMRASHACIASVSSCGSSSLGTRFLPTVLTAGGVDARLLDSNGQKPPAGSLFHHE